MTLGPVTCPSSSACVAAGTFVDLRVLNKWPLVLTGLGKSWKATKPPLPANAITTYQSTAVTSLACPAASRCVAAGTYAGSAGAQDGLLLSGIGSTWKAIEAPLPANAIPPGNQNVQLWSVACASVSSCVAVGSYTDSSAGQQALLLTGSGTSWKATEAPLPVNAATGGPETTLASVTCSSASSCVAVGTYNDSSGGLEGLLVTGSGTSWKATEAPLPANAAAAGSQNASLAFPPGSGSVACSSATSCVAVGSYLDSSTVQHGLLVTGSGTSWKATEAPLPANAGQQTQAGMVSVACPAQPPDLPSGCTALGSYASAGSILVLTESGTSWKPTAVATPADAAGPVSWLGPLTCPSASTCVAAGSYYAGSVSNIDGLLLTGHWTAWTAIPSPLPANAAPPPNNAQFNFTACASTAVCVTAGSYTDKRNNGAGVLLTWTFHA